MSEEIIISKIISKINEEIDEAYERSLNISNPTCIAHMGGLERAKEIIQEIKSKSIISNKNLYKRCSDHR